MLLHRNSTVLITYKSQTTQKTKGILELKLTKVSKTLCVCVCVCVSHLVVSDSLWPHGLQPTRFLCPLGLCKFQREGTLMQPLECPLAARIRVYREICCIFLLPQKEERHSRQGRGSDKHQIVTTCSFEKVRFRWEGQPARFNGSPWVSPPAGLWSIF